MDSCNSLNRAWNRGCFPAQPAPRAAACTPQPRQGFGGFGGRHRPGCPGAPARSTPRCPRKRQLGPPHPSGASGGAATEAAAPRAGPDAPVTGLARAPPKRGGVVSETEKLDTSISFQIYLLVCLYTFC